MLTMMVLGLAAVFFFRLVGFGLRAFGRVIAWIFGAAIVLAVLGGMVGLIGAMFSLTVRALPLIGLVALGIFIGRRLRDRGSIGSRSMYGRIDGR